MFTMRVAQLNVAVGDILSVRRILHTSGQAFQRKLPGPSWADYWSPAPDAQWIGGSPLNHTRGACNVIYLETVSARIPP